MIGGLFSSDFRVQDKLFSRYCSGDLGGVELLFPIPNRTVKRTSADDSIRATVCENTSSPE